MAEAQRVVDGSGNITAADRIANPMQLEGVFGGLAAV